MSEKILEFKPKTTSKDDLLKAVDYLKSQIESGTFKGFIGIGFKADNGLEQIWTGDFDLVTAIGGTELLKAMLTYTLMNGTEEE